MRRYERKIRHTFAIESSHNALSSLENLSEEKSFSSKIYNKNLVHKEKSDLNSPQRLQNIDDIPYLVSGGYNPFMVN